VPLELAPESYFECLLIHHSRYSYCNPASRIVFGVLDTQRVKWLATFSAGVGVCRCTSSFEITYSGLKGIRPAPLKPPSIFFSVIAA
jgi:hypothetical protein